MRVVVDLFASPLSLTYKDERLISLFSDLNVLINRTARMLRNRLSKLQPQQMEKGTAYCINTVSQMIFTSKVDVCMSTKCYNLQMIYTPLSTVRPVTSFLQTENTEFVMRT